MLVYWFGLLYPDLRPRLRRVTARGLPVWFGALLLLSGLIALLTRGIPGLPHAILENLRSVLTMLLINPLLERISIGNKPLFWLGNHVFECYLLQRIPMILLAHLSMQELSIVLFICGSAAVTGILAQSFSKLLEQFDRVVFDRKPTP